MRIKFLLSTLCLALLTLFGVGLALPSGQVKADCSWAKTFDFTASNYDFDYAWGVYTPSVGIVSEGGPPEQVAFNSPVWDPTVTLTQILYAYTISDPANVSNGISILIGEGGQDFTGTDSEDAGYHVFDTGPIVDGANVSGISFYVSLDTGSFTLTTIELHGEGANPWGLGEGCDATATPTPSGGGGSIVITVVVVYPTPSPTITPGGPTLTPTANYIVRATQATDGEGGYQDYALIYTVDAGQVMIGFLLALIFGTLVVGMWLQARRK